MITLWLRKIIGWADTILFIVNLFLIVLDIF